MLFDAAYGFVCRLLLFLCFSKSARYFSMWILFYIAIYEKRYICSSKQSSILEIVVRLFEKKIQKDLAAGHILDL